MALHDAVAHLAEDQEIPAARSVLLCLRITGFISRHPTATEERVSAPPPGDGKATLDYLPCTSLLIAALVAWLLIKIITKCMCVSNPKLGVSTCPGVSLYAVWRFSEGSAEERLEYI